MNAQSSRNFWIWLAPVCLALALFTGLLLALPADAVSFNPCVHPTGAGSCYTTIQAAVTGLASGATITIAAGTYPEHVIVGTKVFTFIGAGADSTFVDGGATGRVFSVTATSATFADLTIQNGKVIGDSGGGIYAGGALTLTDVDVLSNTVDALIIGSQGGGGVRVRSELRVTGGRFENNLVTGNGEGGAIFSNAPTTPHPTVTISGTTFFGNVAAYGGGISLSASVWLTNTQFISNSATSRGGGLFNSQGGTLTLFRGRFERNAAGPSSYSPRGGGLFFAGAAVVEGTEFISNTVNGNSGGGGARINGAVTLVEVDFMGNRATGSSGGGLYAGSMVTVTNGAFTDNRASGNGGGVYVASGGATVTGTHFVSNTTTAGSGGGVYVSSGGATLTGTRFISNTSSSSGGGASIAGGATTVVDSQFTSNAAIGVGTGDGGGLNVAITSTVISTQFISNSAGYRGGGLFTARSLTLIDTDFLSNTASGSGGGLHLNYMATVTGGVFLNNRSDGSSGGGLYVGDAGTLTGTKFISNIANGFQAGGGGLYVGKAATLTGAQFISNTTRGSGGGLYFSRFSSSMMLTLVDTEIRANTAVTSGGGVYAYGPVTVVGTQFIGNSATAVSSSGGGLYADFYLVMTDTQLIRNSAANGGGIYVFGGVDPATSRMVNVLLAANSASTNGAALYLYPSDSSGNSGDRTATIVHTTIASPTVGAGQAIFVGKPPTRYTPTVNITNTLIASYTTGIEVTEGVTFTSDYNFFFNAPTTEVIGSYSISGVHFLLFADAAGDDYRPSLGSPAPTHGLYLGVATDLDGSRRPLSGPLTDPPTIGAYEGTPYPYLLLSKTVTPTSQIPYHSVVTYTIELNNAGSLTDTVIFTDALPTGVTFGGWVANPGASAADNTITWPETIVDLAGGDTLVFTATHTGGYGVVITNTALASGAGPASSATAAFSVEADLCENTLVVQNTGDSGAGSLRQAIADVCPGGTVDFDLTYPATITLTSGEIAIDKALTIDGPGAAQVAVSGNGASRVFTSSAGVAIDGLTLRDGSAAGAGGALYTSAWLTLTASHLLSNTAQGGAGGALYLGAGGDLADMLVQGNRAISSTIGDGGGIASYGPLSVTRSTIVSNTAAGNELGGGGIFISGATAVISGTTVSYNRATGDDGGGIALDFRVSNAITLTNSILQGNTADDDGAGMKVDAAAAFVENSQFIANSGAVDGGAMHVDLGSSVTVVGSTFTQNAVTDDGGAIFLATDAAGLIITATTLLSNTAVGSGGAAYLAADSAITESQFRGNQANLNGGAINIDATTVTVGASTFGANHSINENGGAITNDSSSVLVVNSSTFAGNTALTAGKDGGAIYNANDGGNVLRIDGSTFTGNRAYEGGAIRSRDYLYLSNSTFHANAATDATGGGGALRLQDTAYITNTTIYSNSAPGNGGGVRISVATGAYAFANVIMAGNSGGQCSTAGGVFGGSVNLVTDASCGASFTQVDNVLLGALGDYGGATQTVPLLPGSPAIDAGGGAACPTTDQRNVTRPQGSACDIGAFESRGFNIAASTGGAQHAAIGAAFAQPLSLTLTSAYTEPVVGGQVVFTAPVSGASITAAVVTRTVDAGGVVSAAVTANQTVGSYAVTGAARGFVASVTFTLTNAPGPTTTALTSAPSPSSFGESVTFTATVTVDAPGAGTPTGVVTFTTTSGNLGTANLSAGGVATFTTSSLAAGSHVITATYGGDANFQASTSSSVPQTVNQADTTSMLVHAPSTTVYGQAVTFTATVTVNPPGAGTPSGVVTFTTASGDLGTGNLDVTGVATYSTPSLPIGSHVVTATYGGDASFVVSTSSPVTQTVNPANTSTALASAPNPAVFGPAVTFTATVTVNWPGAGTPTGTVTFTTASGNLGTGSLSAGGVATLTTNSLAAGSHVVTATYGGDANFVASTSSAVTQTVDKAPATVNLASLSQTYDGAPKPATVTTSPPGLTVTVTYNGGGSAPTNAGSYTVAGTVNDANYTGVATDTLVIAQAATTTTLPSAPNPSPAGASVTFTATVTVQPTGGSRSGDAGGAGRLRISGPTGNVTFKDGATTLGTVALVGPVATFSTASLTVGVHAITAVYAGNDNYASSTSPVLNQAVDPGVTAHNDAAGSFQATAVTIAVLSNDVNPAGGALTVVAVGPSTHGGATAIAADAQTVIYTPTAIFTGTDSFTYTVQDSNHATSTAQVAVVVSAQQTTEQPPQVAPQDPAFGGTAAFSSTQAAVGLGLPAGFYTGTVGPTDIFYLAYTPVTTPTHTAPPGGWMLGDYVFTLVAYVNDIPVTPMIFAAPVTVTLVYSPAQFAGLKLDTLTLHAWDETTGVWSTAGMWLVEHITPTHTLVYTITHLTEFGLLGQPTPTAADLADVSTQVTPGAVTLSWATTDERDLLGFHLYRGATAAAPDVRLTADLLPAQGSGGLVGFAYAYVDAVQAPPGTSWFYWIETVAFGGAATRHGPVEAFAPADPATLVPRAFLPVIVAAGRLEQPALPDAPADALPPEGAPEPKPTAAPPMEAAPAVLLPDLAPSLYLPVVTNQ